LGLEHRQDDHRSQSDFVAQAVSIDRVELTPLKDPITRLQALISGQVDVTQGLSQDDLADLQEQGYRVAIESDAQVLALALRNVGNKGSPLQDVRVRQALNYAVNKEAIAHDILHDTVQPVGQGAIPGVAGYNPDIKPYPYDPAKAKALLAEAGHPNGLKLTAKVQVQSIVSAAEVFSAVASDLRAVGVDLEMRQVLGQEWVRMYASGNWGGADIISVSWNAAAFNDVSRAIETFSCSKPGEFFCAPEITPLAEASDAQLDPVKRDRQLQEIMARFHDLAPSIYLVNVATILASSPRVGPMVYTRSGLLFDRMTFMP
jgi:peptide/nickel transport system substrate-binding protein